MNFLKRQLPVLLAFAFGVAFWAQYFIPNKLSQNMLAEFAGSWLVIIAGAALILGVLSAVHYHSSKVRLKRPGWAYSIITLTAFAITAFVGLFPIRYPGFRDVAVGDHSPLQWIFSYIFNPLEATMFALLAFFIASAAFRAFRARSPEATVLLIAAIFLMIGRVPIGELITIIPEGLAHSLGAIDVPNVVDSITMQDVSQWIFNVPNNAAQRGILFGVVLSQIAIALRIIFGIERTYMGGAD
jgi:hypothetical protein